MTDSKQSVLIETDVQHSPDPGNPEKTFRNLTPAELYEHAICNGEGILTKDLALRVLTGKYTGRSPKDRFIVDEPSVHNIIDWGTVNSPVSDQTFDKLYKKVTAYLGTCNVYIKDMFAGASKRYRLNVRIVSEAAYHGLFVHNMFIRPEKEELESFQPDFTIFAAPNLHANPSEDGTRSDTFILINFKKRIILIGGTLYSGELKKGVFTVLNALLPARDVMPMHCSANMDNSGKTALFFGLSGTGKTTLSSDPERMLIGDDEHGWSDEGIFNFEGGCYAKTIRLTEIEEPLIYRAAHMPGTILENVVLDDTRTPLFDDTRYTENTRCAYPIHYIDGASTSGIGGHPSHIIFLTLDAFGVLPPVSKLSPEQAMYHFISGYTSKVAGTERGITDPEATFSACFGSPFMPRHPNEYATLLAKRIKAHNSKVWLVNTGWTGGSYGSGNRIKLHHTRQILSEILNGHLDTVETVTDPVFGVAIPKHVNGVPDTVLIPELAWRKSEHYYLKARKLANMFVDNFRQFETEAGSVVLHAGPKSG